MRAANIAVAIAFVLFAALQYNDPDPWIWMAVYVAGAAIAVLVAARGRAPRSLTASAGAFGLAGAVLHAVGWPVGDAVQWTATTEIFDDEVFREAAGLLLVGGWSVVLAVVAARPAANSDP